MRKDYKNMSIQSAHVPLTNIGSIKDKDSAGLSPTGRTLAAAEVLAALANPKAVVYNIPAANNMIAIYATCAADSEDSKAKLDIYLGSKGNNDNCDLFKVCTLDIAAPVGSQSSVEGGVYCTVFTVTENTWPSAIELQKPAASHANFLLFDRLGFDTLVVHAHTQALNASENIKVYVSGV
jgi:hypothetical protein